MHIKWLNIKCKMREKKKTLRDEFSASFNSEKYEGGGAAFT